MSSHIGLGADTDVLITDCGLTMSRDPSYALDCNLCDKQFVDVETAAIHAMTEKHKRLREYSGPSNLSEGSCDVDPAVNIMRQNVIMVEESNVRLGKCLLCSCNIDSMYQAMCHISSRRHKQNLDWYQRLHAGILLGKFSPSSDRNLRPTDTPYDEGDYTHMTPLDDFVISHEAINLIKGLPEGIVIRPWEYFCTLCEAKCQSEDQIVCHANSHGHTAALNHRHGSSRSMYDRNMVAPPSRDTDWKSAVRAGLIPAPPLNRRPMRDHVRDVDV